MIAASPSAGVTETPSAITISRPMPAPSSASACATGVSPTTITRRGGMTGSRKTSIAPPLRHGFDTSTAPSSCVRDGSPGTTLSRTGSCVPSARRLNSRTDASTQFPPTKPSIRPDARISATSPARALVGCCARTTVARTNGSRRVVNSSACAARASFPAFMELRSDRGRRPALHGRPDPGRRAGHVDRGHAERREGVDDRVHDRRRGADRRRLSDALRTDRVMR